MLDLTDGGAGVIRNAGTAIDDDSVRDSGLTFLKDSFPEFPE
jgi:hypothetical protein